jgi:branched-chain amino acid transport system permease protein
MLEVLITGCVLGAVYALTTGSLIITYVSSGVLNFAYAALAYFVARMYYFLHVQHGWGIAPAAVLSVLVVGPALGTLLWAVLFRFIRGASSLIKIVVTVGLAVCVPPIATLAFGNIVLSTPPGLAPEPVKVFNLAGTAITMDQIIVYVCAVVILGGGAALLQWTRAGLVIRAVVDSEALASLSGIKGSRVAVGVWASSTLIAGLVGVLIAPISGLDIDALTAIMTAAFSAVVVARLRRVGVGVLVAFALGIGTSIAERYLPPQSLFTASFIPSIPFVILLMTLLYAVARGNRMQDPSRGGAVLDAALSPHGESEIALAVAAGVSMKRASRSLSVLGPAAVLVVVAVLPVILQDFWTGVLGLGLAYAVVFLSYTIVSGEGGIIWLCQITFAGIGAFTTGELATNYDWPILAAMVAGGLICVVIGTIIGFLTIRLGDLYVALVTLSFGILADNTIFQLPALANSGLGVAVPDPGFVTGNRSFAWFTLAVFVVVAVLFVNFRRATLGMAVAAARWSDPAARAMGLNVLSAKIAVSGFGAFVAGVGGGLLAVYAGAAIPDSFATFSGLIWLAVLVTVGVRSPMAALVAGLLFSFLPAITTAYLPTSWGEVPPALFGIGAVLVARNPEGTLAMHANQLRQLVAGRRAQSPTEMLVSAAREARQDHETPTHAPVAPEGGAR